MTSLKEWEHLSVPFPLIEAATEKFTTRIGTGGYGHVYKGKLSLFGELRTVAVKRLSTKESLGGQGIKEFLTEIQLLSRYKHPNIVSLLGFCKQGDEKILIYEYAEHGSLDTYLRGPSCTFTWKQRINICIDAACGIDHLHNHVSDNHRVIHRDIKSGNILLGHNWKAMIADLGLSKRGLTNENDSCIVTHACGTDAYLDPEYRRTGILTKESDIYSFGVVLFEVLCGRLGYMNVQDNRRYLDHLARCYYEERKLDDIIDPILKNRIDSNSLFTYSKIAYECLLKNRLERPAIATVVKQLKDALKFQDNMDKGPKLTNHEAIKDSPKDELKGLINRHTALPDNIGVGENTYETKSEAMPFQENWIPICLPESWDDDVLMSNQSEVSVVTNLVDTGARDSKGVLDEIFWEHVGITVNILCMKKSDCNTRQLHLIDDLLVKCFSVLKKLLDNNGGEFGDSYITHWVAIVELYNEVIGCAEDASGRLLYESVACIRIIISSVEQVLKASMATKDDEVVTNTTKKILDHAKALGVIDTLLNCLVTCGTSLMSGSSNLLRVACEACEVIWSLIDAFEIQSEKENGGYVFPLSSESLDEINNKGDYCAPFIGKYPEKIVEVVTQAFLNFKAIQVAMFYCLRQRFVVSWSSVIQIILRCCIHNDSVVTVLCGLSNYSVVSGGGDNTIVSEVFSIISMCTSFNRDPQSAESNSLKCKVSDPSALILHSCLFVASVAQSLESARRRTAKFMLTSSPLTQQSRITDLAHHYSLCDGKQNLQPHSMSAMLALSSILYLEYNSSTKETIYKIAFPLIPETTTLCDYIRILTTGTEGDKTGKLMLSYWHGFRDGCVGLLYYKLIWAGSLEIREFGVDIIQIYIDMLRNAHSYETGLSQYGVVWTLYSLAWYLKGGSSNFHLIMLTREHVKVVCDLISDVHLKRIGCSMGPGGGKNGMRDIVRAVSWLMRIPLDIYDLRYVLGKMKSADSKDMVKEIKKSKDKYIQVILEVRLPGQLIKCLAHLELKDIEEPFDLISIMVDHRSLAVELVGKGLLNPNLMRRLLDNSSPTQVKLRALIILSKVTKMDEDLYKQIGGEIVQQLKALLTHEDSYVRGYTCNAIGEMCRHSSYFYSLLAKHNILGVLVGLVSDKDDYPQSLALSAIRYATQDSDVFYEDLRICIPQLAKLLLSTEPTHITKKNAATCLANLSTHSNKLGEDMISKGAIQALLNVVGDCSVVALDQTKIDDAIDDASERLLYNALYALAMMCKHQPCRQFIGSSDVYPTIGQLRESSVEDIASYATLIYNRASET